MKRFLIGAIVFVFLFIGSEVYAQSAVEGDIDGDGDVDIFDYNLLISDFGKTTTTPTPTTKPTISPPPPQGKGIWLSQEEIRQLPTSGGAWNNVVSKANSSIGTPNLSGRSREQVTAMAKGLYYARTQDASKAQEVRNAISQVMGTEGSDPLATLRAVGGWVIAADLIDLKSFDPSLDNTFRSWLRNILNGSIDIGGTTLKGKTKSKPNNWGTAGHFSWAAAAAYLGDKNELNELA